MSIFMNNQTQLSPVALDPKYMNNLGFARTLIEQAENDHKMFEACVALDCREMSLKESADITALHEGAISSIWAKIKELFAKFKAKIQSIFKNIMAKFNSLTMSNKAFAKKYRQVALRKYNLEKTKVKYSEKLFDMSYDVTYPDFDIEDIKNKVAELTTNNKKFSDLDSEDKTIAASSICLAFTGFTGKITLDDIRDQFDDDDSEVTEIGDISGAFSSPVSWWTALESSDSEVKKINKKIKDLIKSAEKVERRADKEARDAAKGDNPNNDDITFANAVYSLSSTIISIQTQVMNLDKNRTLKQISYLKAGCAKMATVSNKKLEEVADLFAEAEAEEVDEILANVDGKDVFPENWDSSNTNLLGEVDRKDVDFGYEDYHRPAKNAPVDGTVGRTAYESAVFSNVNFV